MLVSFELVIESIGYTDDSRLCVVVRNFRGKKAEMTALDIANKGLYTHRISNSRVANVYTRKVDYKEAGKLRRKSAGFGEHEWMIDSIINNGYITEGI